MTDDPRLEAVTKAWSDFCGDEAPGREIARERARFYCAMIRAFLGEDGERKEVMPHPEPRPAQHNAPAPVAAGADPLSLYDATVAVQRLRPMHCREAEAIVRAVLRVANAQPVSEGEPWRCWACGWSIEYDPTGWLSRREAALEAAAKVRAGG